MYVYRWRKTKFSPLSDAMQGRSGTHCKVLARGRNGNWLLEFEADGYRVVSPKWAVRRA